MKKKALLVFVVLLVLEIFIYNFLEKSKEKDINNILTIKLEEITIAKDAVLNTYAVVTKKYYYDILHNQKVLDILKAFKTADVQQQGELRKELFLTLQKEYNFLKEHLYIKQMQFHTVDGRSLLRFHAPLRYGDSLTSQRDSIKKMLLEHRRIIGFEGGKVFSGFRYIYPIFYNNGEYLGSVEFSLDFLTVQEKVEQLLGLTDALLVLHRSVSYDKVFSLYKTDFSPSIIHKDYFIEGNKKQFRLKRLTQQLLYIAKESKKIQHCFKEHKSCVLPIYYQNKSYAFLVLDIKDIAFKDVGFAIIIEENPKLMQIKERYFILELLSVIAFVLLYILVIVILWQIEKNKAMAKKLQKFIDTQDSIVILTNTKTFHFANKSFMDFFGVENLNEFLKKHQCICECFEEKEGFFSYDTQSEKSWIEQLLELSPRQRIVSMKDTLGIPHAFSVAIRQYDAENYVVNFSDITETMQEKLHYEQLMIKDQLTKAYNRTYFEKNINKILEKNKKQKKITGVIFFDIDHFKAVNDSFGHDVGDEVLRSLAALIKKNIRSKDILIRWGGEEFVILLLVNSAEDVRAIAENLRVIVQNHKFDKVQHITCSFGCCVYHYDDDILKTIKKADVHLYKAKTTGRNKVVGLEK